MCVFGVVSKGESCLNEETRIHLTKAKSSLPCQFRLIIERPNKNIDIGPIRLPSNFCATNVAYPITITIAASELSLLVMLFNAGRCLIR